MSTQRDYRPDWQRCVQNQRDAGSLLIGVALGLFVIGITFVALAGWWAGL